MTLDDLIEQLLTIRRDCPAAATATVIGFEIDRVRYDRGEVRFGVYDPRTCEVFKIEMPAPLAPGSRTVQ
jgi:hypothetical protein